MFVAIGIILTILALLEVSNKLKANKLKLIYNIMALLLLMMLCFRYGQGTDYHAYELQYGYVDRAGTFLVNTLYHGELGWYILMLICKRIGLGFSLFIGAISFVTMLLTIKAINKYSPYKITSLLLLYPTFYLTYYYSAVRQGLVFSLFLFFGIDWLTRKKYIKFIALVIIMTLFHTSAIVLIILPIVLLFKDRRPGKWVFIAFAFAIIVGYSGILNGVASSFGVSSYFSVSISIMAIILRTILFYMVWNMRTAIQDSNHDLDVKESMLYYIYIFGYLFYIMFAFSSTLSQRLTMPMKGLEIILIPVLVYKLYKSKQDGSISHTKRITYIKMGRVSILLMLLIVMLVLNVEMFKNIDSYLTQGNYYDWVNVFNYPYISVFNKEDIFNFISHFD